MFLSFVVFVFKVFEFFKVFEVFGGFGGVGIHIAHCQDPFRQAGCGIQFHYMIL